VSPGSIISRAQFSSASSSFCSEVKDLNRARSYLVDVANRHGTPCFYHKESGVADAVQQVRLCSNSFCSRLLIDASFALAVGFR
jgi:hypothetical protein